MNPTTKKKARTVDHELQKTRHWLIERAAPDLYTALKEIEQKLQSATPPSETRNKELIAPVAESLSVARTAIAKAEEATIE